MIEKLLVTTIERRPAKMYVALGHLYSMGYPTDERLEFFRCYDMIKYDSVQEIRDAAIQDGFACFNNLEINGLLPETGRFVWLWTWLSCLRRIIESNACTLLLIDDILPVIHWEQMCFLLKEVMSPNFRAIQLWNEDLLPDYRGNHHTQICASLLGKGFRCMNDCGFILSTLGAKFLYEKTIRHAHEGIHTMISRIAVEGNVDGLYHALGDGLVVNNRRWATGWK